MLTSDSLGRDQRPKPICLEFTNTMRWHASVRPDETLRSYADLLAWARTAGLASDRSARHLLSRAKGHQADADLALTRAISLREAIYRIFLAEMNDTPAQGTDLDVLNGAISQLTDGVRLAQARGEFTWEWRVDKEALDSFLWPIALSAVELLLSEDRHWVGQCADDRGCGWLFLDTSKNHSRRWCDMNDCGNRAKQRRLQERRQRAG
jgi:predicted RNA-binding Zn ribbon-like protein